MAKKAVKKVDVKKVAKSKVYEMLANMFAEAGIEVLNGAKCGFTDSTLVANLEKCDIQIKLITPKAGVDRYPVLEVEEEDAAEPENQE